MDGNELNAFLAVVEGGFETHVQAWPILQGWLSRPMEGFDEEYPPGNSRASDGTRLHCRILWPTMARMGIRPPCDDHGRICVTLSWAYNDCVTWPAGDPPTPVAVNAACRAVRLFLESARRKAGMLRQVAVHLRMPAADPRYRALVALVLLKSGVSSVFPDIVVPENGTLLVVPRNDGVSPAMPLPEKLEDSSIRATVYGPCAGSREIWDWQGNRYPERQGGVPPVLDSPTADAEKARQMVRGFKDNSALWPVAAGMAIMWLFLLLCKGC